MTGVQTCALPISQSSNNCPSPVNIPVLAGAGVFRFSDGSLLTVRVNSGGLCIDLVNGVAHISESVQVTGGTGRFQGASGTLSMTGTVAPVFFVKDSNFQALMLMVTGEFSGLMYGSGLGDGGGE